MARNRPPSFDFYPDDFVAGTMGMHPAARGIYITLLCHQWSHGSVNLTNSRQLVQITGAMPDELEEHLPEVRSKFEQCDDGHFFNARLRREYERKAKVMQSYRENGKRGGRPRSVDEENQLVTQADNPLGNQADNQAVSKSKTKRVTKEKPSVEVGSRKLEAGSDQKKNVAFDPLAVDLPFASPAFVEAWADFVQMRRETKHPLKPTGCKGSLKKLVDMGESRAIAALVHTTANEWQGIREPDGRRGKSSSLFDSRNDESTPKRGTLSDA